MAESARAAWLTAAGYLTPGLTYDDALAAWADDEGYYLDTSDCGPGGWIKRSTTYGWRGGDTPVDDLELDLDAFIAREPLSPSPAPVPHRYPPGPSRSA